MALLIGNQAYNEKVGPLKNPHNDVALVGAAVERLGFNVTRVKDAGYVAIDAALKRHVQQVRRAGKDAISFLYYSGHGASDPDTQINYLIPIDVESANDSSLWTNSLELGDILNKLRNQAPEATHFVVFDACREELRLTREDKKALGTGKGFVALGNVSGVMIAYATAPGKTASDQGEGAGPYAKALADEIIKPGIEAVTMFRNVQLRVKLAIGQDPWLTLPTFPAVYFAGETSNALSQEREIEVAYWESVRGMKSPALLATYLERYPTGIYASLARAMIEELKAEPARREDMSKATEAVRIETENSAPPKEREASRRKEALARAELHKTMEETRLAREEARKAEEQRLAAINAIEEAKARAKQAGLAAEVDDKSSPLELAKDPPALTRALQRELKRVGCYPGEPDGTWAPKTKEALAQFARLLKLDISTDVPSSAALQAVIDKRVRVCPLICGSGERNVNGNCVANARPMLRRGIPLDSGDPQGVRDFCQGSSVCRSMSNP